KPHHKLIFRQECDPAFNDTNAVGKVRERQRLLPIDPHLGTCGACRSIRQSVTTRSVYGPLAPRGTMTDTRQNIAVGCRFLQEDRGSPDRTAQRSMRRSALVRMLA